MKTRKTVPVQLAFLGDGTVVEKPRGCFHGGVPDPEPGPSFGFSVVPEVLDEDGYWNPTPGAEAYRGSLQVNLWGDSHALREIGRYLLALAELDATADPGFHQHHEVTSTDGCTRLHLIVRKQPAAEQIAAGNVRPSIVPE
jgi:hypothetical protein